MLMVVILSQESLKRVLVITRHGIRLPLVSFPNDPCTWTCLRQQKLNFQHSNVPPPNSNLNLVFDVKKSYIGSCFAGQLADQGFVQHESLSDIWFNLYPNHFTHQKLRSTTKERVRLSGAGQLQKLNLNLSIVHEASIGFDSLAITNGCPYEYQYIKYIREHIDYKKDELNDLRTRSGWKTASWENFGDNFIAREAMGTEYPDYVTETDKKLAVDIQDEMWRNMFNNQNESLRKTYLTITSGPFVKDFQKYLETETFYIVSGHDVTITPLAQFLFVEGQWTKGLPGYASFLNAELWDINGEEMIKIRFRDGDSGLGQYMKIKPCGDYQCSKKQVFEFMNTISITNDQQRDMCQREFQV
ncbi:Acid_phosphatase [Hexamita inflata]|uniref:Acid phosphatase n=1 Tax=Hexamita inflata TaxID=28002 RepID=A0AA86RA22_9EUKA|nr:Acid phosphatase [Hexamita inflata]